MSRPEQQGEPGVDQDPNRRRWVDAAEHVATYRATDGAVGHTWADRPHLLLSTTGRRSGREHTVPLVYARLPDAERGPVLVVAASAGGAERHPAWFHNLVAHPDVAVQLWGRRWRTGATVAEGAQEEAGWAAMARTWDGFRRYREETARRIPLVLLAEQAREPRPDGAERDR
ncbi:nitroreductase/quinone reductase family protein [Aquipuribacter sp. MA13-6]|uniref:nitroreductase/quinone reductase family protein n=1 Tax=unclassified Aquipuribacter TaxID=2635084 RepID=UPI003EEC9B4A